MLRKQSSETDPADWFYLAGERLRAADLTQEFFAQHYPGGDWTNLGLDYERLRQQLGQLVTAIAAQLPQFFQAAK